MSKTFFVYHAENPNFGMPIPGRPTTAFPAGFVLVAEVQTGDLDDVFRLTNHIDHDWRTNLGVSPTPAAQRSTSVGDVVVEGSKVWRCAFVGWEEIA